ncbi:MAG: heme-binding protein [Methanoregula sp.]|uniref:SOUL family heme-binding protein n=1 Tax=Methanoregula sp. TaxID=2052170 RepID=UPI003BAFD214
MRRSVLAASALALILFVAFVLLLFPSTDTIPFTVTGKKGEIEFRQYPPLVLATVNNSEGDNGFNLLFAYITGNNKPHTSISMTAPVIMSQQIAMTAPVLSSGGSMSFVMPAGKIRDEIPDPLDNRVTITTVPGREIAVVRFSGYASQKDIDAETSRLLEGLANANITPAGQPFLMRYNPPWTPGFLRRNEVAIEIQH